MAHKTLTTPRTPAAYRTLARQVRAFERSGNEDAADRLVRWVDAQLGMAWDAKDEPKRAACIESWEAGA